MPVAMRLLALAAVLLGCVLSTAKGEYGPRDAVTVLTDKNFEKEVLQSGDYWLVEFYAPWCGHCQKLEPEYKAAAKKLKQHARLGAVDATANQKLAQKYQIKGYPTIKEFGAKKKRPRDYQGGRTRNDIVQYVKSSEEAKKLGVGSGRVASLEFASVHAFLTSKELPSAIFFGSQSKKSGKKASGKAPAWLSNVADHFTTVATDQTKKKRAKKTPTVQVGFVPGSDGKIAAHFGLQEDALPTVLFVDASGTKFMAAEDALPIDEASAKAFISRALASSVDDADSFASVPLFPSPEVAKKKPKVALQTLTPRKVRQCLSPSLKQMCVVVATNEEAGGDAVRGLAKKYRRDPFAFFTTSGTDAVFRAVTDFVGEPASEDVRVVVIKAGRKIKYSVLTRSGDADASIDAFLDKLLDGSTGFTVASGDQGVLEAALDAQARTETHSAGRDEL